jgi:probable O-glycosylation ligase (exosortase A-associated)
MWYWISLMNPHKDVWGGVFARIPYALIVALATLISLALTKSEPKLPPRSKATVLIVLLMIWISITSPFGSGPPDQLYGKWLLGEKMLLMTLVAFALTTTRERLDQLIVVCVVSISIYGVKGGIVSLLTAGRHHVFGPDGTMIGDNNDLGVALTMTLPMMFYLRERYSRPAVRRAIAVAIGLTFIGDVFTYSRGALVAMSAIGIALWLRSRKRLSLLPVLVVAAVGVWNFAPAAWTSRMLTIDAYQRDSSAEGRILMWRRSWAIAQLHPIVGAGFQWSFDPNSVNAQLRDTGIPPLTHALAPHSIWFEMLGNQGFPGLALFLAIITGVFFDAHWIIRHTVGKPELRWANSLGRMAQVALVGYCAGGSFATQGMYDGFYAMVIIVAAARRIVAAELAASTAVSAADVPPATARKPTAALEPQPSG